MHTLRLIGLAALVLTGCSDSPTHLMEAPVPQYDPDGIAKGAITAYDRNSNGSLERAELSGCPALLAAFAEIDTTKDQRLAEGEIRTRAEAYKSVGTGSVDVGCVINLDGRPLDGATVTFVPEAFMGGAIKPAVGKTDEAGRCDAFEIDGKRYRGLGAGLYKIQVTKDGVTIPARYNTQTTLGAEVYPNKRAGQVAIALELTGR